MHDCLQPVGSNLFSKFSGMKFGLVKKFPEFMPLQRKDFFMLISMIVSQDPGSVEP